MTYGWAILIIAVVLAALFSLGVFNTRTAAMSTSCSSRVGYLCSNPVLLSNGLLSTTIGSSQQMTVTGVACSSGSSAPSSFSPANIALAAGAQQNVDFPCPLSSNALGTPFSGTLWLRYDEGGQSGLVTQAASVGATVTGQGSGGGGSGSTTTTPATTTIPSTTTISATTTIPSSTCYPLSLSYGTGGSSVDPSPANSPGCPEGNYLSGATITLTATASDSFAFSEWVGYYPTNSMNPWTFTMPLEDASENAEFASTALCALSNYGAVAITSCQSVNVINTQVGATGPGFQLGAIDITPASGTFLAGNWLVYDTATDTPVYAWAESATSLWIKLPASIASGSSYNSIRIEYGAPATPFAWTGGYSGEAPQLSSTYGEYDNGVSVFLLYAGFQGASLPSGWLLEGLAQFNGGTSSTGGVQLMHGQGGYLNGQHASVYYDGFTTMPTVIEFSGSYGQDGGCFADDIGVGFYNSGPAPEGAPFGVGVWGNGGGYQPVGLYGYYAAYEWYWYPGFLPGIIYNQVGQSQSSNKMPYSAANYYLFSQVVVAPTSITMNYATKTDTPYESGVYSGLTTATSWQTTPVVNYADIYVGSATGTCTADTYAYWIRARTYPPNNIMPTVSYGALT